jgi:hypothetical protein
MKSNELSRVLQRAITLLVPVGSYYGDLEAYTTSEDLMLVTKEDRFCSSIFVQTQVVSLSSTLDMIEMSFCGDRSLSWSSPI